MSGVDFIGDTHGHADRHEAILWAMGYRGFSHPEGRRIVYLGDSPNRGPAQEHNINLHRNMIGQGTARMVMGNHEFKAIMYARTGKDGHYLRPHTLENTAEHLLFLKEFEFGSDKYHDAIKFFETLPVFIAAKDFNVVHAFWSADAIRTCRPYLNKDGTLKPSAYEAYTQPAHRKFHEALSLLLKGPTYDLATDLTVVDSTGDYKDKVRHFWWQKYRPPEIPKLRKDEPKWLSPVFRQAALKVRQDALVPLVDKGDQFVHELNDAEIRTFLRQRSQLQYKAKKPLFIGHYNLVALPDIDHAMVACLNYKDRIVAYRWDPGDKGLDPAKLVCV